MSMPEVINNKLVTWDGLIDYHKMIAEELPNAGSAINSKSGNLSRAVFSLGNQSAIAIPENIHNLVTLGDANNIWSNNKYYLNGYILGNSNKVQSKMQYGEQGLEAETIPQEFFVLGYKNTLTPGTGHADAPQPLKNSIIIGDNNSNVGSNNTYIFGCSNIINTKDRYASVTDSPLFLFGDNLSVSRQEHTKATCIIGQFNDDDNIDYSNYAFIVGGGTSKGDRKNIFSIDYNGRIFISGIKLQSQSGAKTDTIVINESTGHTTSTNSWAFSKVIATSITCSGLYPAENRSRSLIRLTDSEEGANTIRLKQTIENYNTSYVHTLYFKVGALGGHCVMLKNDIESSFTTFHMVNNNVPTLIKATISCDTDSTDKIIYLTITWKGLNSSDPTKADIEACIKGTGSSLTSSILMTWIY